MIKWIKERFRKPTPEELLGPEPEVVEPGKLGVDIGGGGNSFFATRYRVSDKGMLFIYQHVGHKVHYDPLSGLYSWKPKERLVAAIADGAWDIVMWRNDAEDMAAKLEAEK